MKPKPLPVWRQVLAQWTARWWDCWLLGRHFYLRSLPKRERVEFCARCGARRQWVGGEWVKLAPVGSRQKTRAVK